MRILDIAIVALVALVANIAFNNFERHLPLWRRAAKLFVLLAALAAVGLLAGRIAFYLVVAVLTVGQIVLHAWWFPRNGVNGLTAEPYDRYLALIARMKRRERS